MESTTSQGTSTAAPSYQGSPSLQGVYVLSARYLKFARGEGSFPLTSLKIPVIVLIFFAIGLILANVMVRRTDVGTANGMTVIFGAVVVILPVILVITRRKENTLRTSGKLIRGEIERVSQRNVVRTETETHGDQRYTTNKTEVLVKFTYRFTAPDGTSITGSIERESSDVLGYPHLPSVGTACAVLYADSKTHLML